MGGEARVAKYHSGIRVRSTSPPSSTKFQLENSARMGKLRGASQFLERVPAQASLEEAEEA